MLLRAARNEHIKRGLKEAYTSKLPQGMLQVFCVSSTMYDKGIEQESSQLVDGSEIPLLRRFCRSISAEAKFLDATAFLGTQLSSLLSSVTLWAQDTSNVIERQKTIKDDTIYEIFSKTESGV